MRSAFFLGLSCRGVTPAPEHRSLWLQQVEGDSPDRPPLEAHAKADIAILGGGYVGLWTALRIKEHDPACDVAVLEQDICGGGASGRNGGFVLSWWPKLSSLTKLFGAEEAIRICRGSETAITEIQAFCEANHIDADFRRGGWLWTATSQSQLGAWESVVQITEKMGVEVFRRLDPAEVSRRAGSPSHRAGVFRGHRRNCPARRPCARPSKSFSGTGRAHLRTQPRDELQPLLPNYDPH